MEELEKFDLLLSDALLGGKEERILKKIILSAFSSWLSVVYHKGLGSFWAMRKKDRVEIFRDFLATYEK